MRDMLAELVAPPVLVFPDWDAVEDGSRPFRVYCDASIGFGATLEQEQLDGSVRPIAYVTCANFDSGRHWTPLYLEADSLVWAIKRLRGYLWGTKFRIFSDHKALENIGKTTTRESRGGSSTLPRLVTHSSTEREAQMVMLTSSCSCHSRRLSTTTAVLAASPLSTMRPYTLSGLATCSPHWLGWAGAPTR